MEKKVILFVVSALMIGLAIGANYSALSNLVAHRPAGARTNVIFDFETRAGAWSETSGNLITNIGERFLRNTVAYDNETGGLPKWISLSNDATPAATWTKLAGENVSAGFGRAVGTLTPWYRSSDYSYNCSKKFTSTGAATLQCAGLNWVVTADSDNNLFACAAFTSTTFALNDNLTITWIVQFDAN